MGPLEGVLPLTTSITVGNAQIFRVWEAFKNKDINEDCQDINEDISSLKSKCAPDPKFVGNVEK